MAVPQTVYSTTVVVVLAWIKNEPAQLQVDAHFQRALRGDLILRCSIINAGEVYYQLARVRLVDAAELFWNNLIQGTSPVHVEAATFARAKQSALIKASHRVSYADSFVISLAREFNLPITTGDPEIKQAASQGLISLDWIGP